MRKQPHSWNFDALYQSDDDPQIWKDVEAATAAVGEFARKWREDQSYLSDESRLLEALEEFNQLQTNHGYDGKAGYYASLRLAQDESNSALRALESKISDAAKKNIETIQFFLLSLGRLNPAQQKQYLSSDLLIDYKHFLEQIFIAAKYQLSDGEEKVSLFLSESSYSRWVQMVSALLSAEEVTVKNEQGQAETKPFNELFGLIASQNKQVRDDAARGINQILVKWSDVAENEINALLETKKANDYLRGYDRPDRSRHIHDDIETEVVDTMLQTVEKRHDISARFYQLKAQLLGVQQLAYHERGVEYGDLGGEYSFEQAVSLTDQALAGLDSEFQSIFRSFVDGGLIDVFPRKGKHGGAFCTHSLPVLPTYILLNHTNKLRDVTTLAHEVGHGINNELIKKKQKAVYFETPLATAEVASTFMEDFVLDQIARESDQERQLAIWMMKLNDDVSSIFRQVAAYRFEQDLHAAYRTEGYLSKQRIGELFQDKMVQYMGQAVEQSEGSQNWWIYWSHFRSFFYVYSYASGLLISKSLQRSVRQNPNFINQVKEFLSAGLSDSPKNVFARLGIDVTKAAFWTNGLDEIEELLAKTEKLAQQLGRIK